MSTQDQIRDRIETFAAELGALVRQAAIEAVEVALGSARSPATASRTSTPTPSATAARGSAASPTTISFKRKKGAKRTPEQLAQIDAAILSLVKANAGKGVEHMAKALAVPSKDLKPRVALLVDGKKLKKTGVKRATKYFAA